MLQDSFCTLIFFLRQKIVMTFKNSVKYLNDLFIFTKLIFCHLRYVFARQQMCWWSSRKRFWGGNLAKKTCAVLVAMNLGWPYSDRKTSLSALRKLYCKFCIILPTLRFYKFYEYFEWIWAYMEFCRLFQKSNGEKRIFGQFEVDGILAPDPGRGPSYGRWTSLQR